MSNNENGEHKGKYNVVVVNHHACSPDVDGGGRHYELAKALVKDGHSVTVLTASYFVKRSKDEDDRKTKIVNFEEKLTFVRFKTFPAVTNIFTRLINYYHFRIKAGKYNEFNDKPTVIIASSVHPFAWIAGYQLSKKFDAMFIVEVRDLWPLSMYEDFSGILRKFVFLFFESLEKKYYKLADAIVTTAPFAFEYMVEKYNVDREKIFHIPHGINLERFDASIEKQQILINAELKKILEQYFCVTYTGTLSSSEGLPTLVKAAKYLEKMYDLRIVIVGRGKEEKKLRQIIHEKNLKNVLMFERHPKDSIPFILKKSDILFCGLKERKVFKYGISKNKFYDYMAASKPIIFASNVRDSLIDKAVAGVTIRPNDPKKLAQNIENLYNNINTLGVEYGKNGRMYVEKYHTDKVICTKFLETIDYTYYKNENKKETEKDK